MELNHPAIELVSTEASYVENLRILIETFMNPMDIWMQSLTKTSEIKNKTFHPDFCLEMIISEEENIVESIFSNIKQIYDVNLSFYEDIKLLTTNGDIEIVSTSFERHAPFFRVYSQYITNFDRANMLLTKMMSDIRFDALIF